MKKIAKIILIAMLTLTMTPLANTQAKTKIKLSKTSISIQKGKTYTLKIKGTKKKVKWSTSKKSIATVTQKGKVTAKKTGNAVITAKIGKKKYKCKVKVYQKKATKKPTNPIGTRTNPADPRKGVTIQTDQGTMYFKLTEVLKGTKAENRFLAMGQSESWMNESHQENPNTRMVLFVYDVQAVKGYSTYPLYGLDIFNPYGLYDGTCSKKINEIESCYLEDDYEALDGVNLELYTGVKSKMYKALWVPNNITSFSNQILTKDYKQYWIKYTF